MPENTHIPIKDLHAGQAYHGCGRNFDVAIWTGKAFAGLRTKFGDRYIDEELHYDTDEHHGTFKPFKLL